jgi:uncharacterized protein (DUF885 family)
MRSLQALRIPVLVALAAGVAPPAPGQATTYDDLLSLFQDWRSFQRPKLAGGVPDYTPAAMAAQQRALAGYRKRLAAIDSAGWPVPQKVDYQVVRAEMNGLDFDHRVLQPWARNPAFYVTVVADESDQPAREGPFAFGTVELFRWRFPLTETQADELAARLAPIPALLRQARGNLTGNARDLWRQGIRAQEQQRNVLAQLRDHAAPHPTLAAAVARALEATDELVRWLKARAPSKEGPSGVGARFASSNTPRGWLRLDGEAVWFEQHLYLQQPGYGTSYVMGKLEIDQLIAARQRALGGDFTLRRFMDELDAAGMVPISLVRWELTGDGDRVPGVGFAQPRNNR